MGTEGLAPLRHSELSPEGRIEALLRLAEASWREMDGRRTYEWKIAFALWTALSLIGWGYLRLQPTELASGLAAPPSLEGSGIVLNVPAWAHLFLVILLCTLACLYAEIWMRGIHERNWRNGRTANFFWDEAERALGVESPRQVHSQSPQYRQPKPLYQDWAHLSQVAFTWILLSADLVIMFVRFRNQGCTMYLAVVTIMIALVISLRATFRGFAVPAGVHADIAP